MKKKLFSCMLMCGMAVVLTACAAPWSEEETETETEDTWSYREEFTEEELAAGSASFQAGEYIYVDASLTPYEVYQDGVDSYYINYASYENQYTDEETILDTFTPFGGSYEEFASRIKEVTGEEIDTTSLQYMLNTNGDGVEMYAFNLSNGGFLVYWCSFFEDMSDEDNIVSQSEICYAPYIYYARNGGNDGADLITADLERLKDYGGDLDFATEEETAAEAIAFIEEMSGLEISDSWRCYTYSEENLKELEDILKEYGDELLFDETLENTETGEEYMTELTLDQMEYEEYFDFYFSIEVNGLPIAWVSSSTTLGTDETVGDSLAANPNNVHSYQGTTEVNPIHVSDMECTVDENGIIEVGVDQIIEIGDVYKNESIMTPSEILVRFLNYLETDEIIIDTLTIENISLVYVSAFTDAENGVLEAALRPYWKVTTYDNWTFEHETYYYNARSGQMWG